MKKLLVGLSLFCAIGLLSDNVPAIEVEGADQIKPGMSFQDLFVIAMPHEVNEAELDAFLAELEDYEAWGNANPDKWDAADKTDDPVTEITSWEELWRDSNLGAARMIMVVVKLQGAQMMAKNEINKDQLQQAVVFMKDVLKNPNVPDEQKARMRVQLGDMQRMSKALDGYPESNIRFYENNKATIDNALDRFEAIGGTEDDATDEEAGGPRP